MNTEVFQALADAAAANEAVALGIITGVKGSSPQKLGAKALFYSDGRIVGTLGGGCLEAEIQQRAVESLRTSQASGFELVLDHDFGWDDGLICGGKVMGVILPRVEKLGAHFWTALAQRNEARTWGVRPDYSIGDATESAEEGGWLYRERVTPPCSLWIAGAGHIAQAVAPLAVQLDFKVTVLDDRPSLANHQFFPESIDVRVGLWDELCSLPLGDAPAFGLIVTRGHRHDALVLKEWIQRPFLFLGMIGSSRKARTIREHFLEEKIATREQLEAVACPVGIRIQSRTVQEIAVSILAQYIDKRAELVGCSQPPT